MLKNDNRKVMLENVLREHNYAGSDLLEILHKSQNLYGYLSTPLLGYLAQKLDLPPSRVFGVATFYSFFKLKAPGEHVVTVCLGTACYVKRSEEILSAVEHEFNLKRGGSTSDGKLSLFVTRCIGACAMAPTLIIDDEVIGKATTEIVIKKIYDVLGDVKT